MSNNSLLKCIYALLVLSLYVWLFGIVGIIDGTDKSVIFADESIDFNPTLSDIKNEKTTKNKSDIVTDAPVTYYETSINAENYKKPGFADYPAQTTAPFYNGLSDSETAPTEELTEPVTETEETAVTTTTTTSMSSTAPTTTLTVTTTPQTTTEALTASETQTTETTKITTSDNSPDLIEDYVDTTSAAVTDGEKLQVDTGGGVIVEDTSFNIISKIVQNEIGSSFNKEAIKAQAVASYTYVKLYNTNGFPARDIKLAKEASARVAECVKEVLGQMIYYNGEIIQAVYGASTAGYTASSLNVYGNDYPYLRSRECPLDMRYDPNYGLSKTFTSNDIMTRVVSKTGIELTGDPETWIKILNHVDSVYVGEITLGGKSSFAKGGKETKLTGRVFREVVMDRDIRSAAFDVSYDKKSDKFTFITYGYGHGAGLSQNGANALAQYEGYDYKQILQFYYAGTEIY